MIRERRYYNHFKYGRAVQYFVCIHAICCSGSPVRIEVVKNFGGFLVAETIEAKLPQGASKVPARDAAASVPVKRLERSQCRWSTPHTVTFSRCSFAAYEPPELGSNVVKNIPRPAFSSR